MANLSRVPWRAGLLAVVAAIALSAELIVYEHASPPPKDAREMLGYQPAPSTNSAPSAVTGAVAGQLVALNGTSWQAQTPGKPWSMYLSPSFDRFEVRTGDSWSRDVHQGKVVKNRAELRGPSLQYGTTYWLAWSMRVPKSSALPATYTIVGQLHALDDKGDAAGRGPVLDFRLVGRSGQYVISTRSDTAVDSLRRPAARDVYTGPAVPRDRWLDLVMSVRVSRTGHGQLFVWLNGKEVVNLPTAAVGYNDRQPPYWKFGNYRPASTGTSIIDYANMTVSTQSLAQRINHPLPPGEGS